MTIGYLGPRGSYSEIAAKMLCPDYCLKAYPTFDEVFSSLEKGECDCIAVPVENSINGTVIQNIDLMESHENAFAYGECTVEIDHRLATKRGADMAKITRVFSHQQALSQCSKFLKNNLPEARLIAVSSTSAGLALIKSDEDAAIVGAHNNKEGFTLSECNIADAPYNSTQFLLVGTGGVKNSKSSKIFFSVTCRHEPGALLKILSPIGEGKFNMTKIGSRPIKEKPGEYRFFIEIEGDISDENCKNMLKKVQNGANSLRILGCY